ncbi:MAG TPA: CHAD domain-containing protein [Verrucomicrobiae bacterium]|jgi:CHAD domain-containing protein
MGCRIAIGESLTSAFSRIAAAEIELAGVELCRSQNGETVHNARKSLKRLRALLRAMREALPKDLYRAENRRLGHAGRELSPLRDVIVQLRTLGKLKAAGSPAGSHLLHQLRHRQFFLLRRIPAQSQSVRAMLEASGHSLAAWPRREATADDLAAGLKRVYSQGRKAFKTARMSPTAAHWHELRKKAKSLGYGLELVREIIPKKLCRMLDHCDDLTEALGDDHDLVMAQKALDKEHRAHPARGLGALPKRIDGKRAALRKRIRKLAPGVFGDKPGAFHKRLRRHLRRAERKSL